MIAVLSWLKDFTAVQEEAAEICSAMTYSGSKVEAYKKEAEGISSVITGKILAIEKHANADTLLLCQVDVSAHEPLQIITAATNVEVGQIVPVALDGAVLADGSKIKKGKLRGELSNGMLCSIEELGYTMADFAEAVEDGIFILPPDTEIGITIQEAMGWNDTIIEFEITSNRPDCFSMEGLARELALTFKRDFIPVEPLVVAKSKESSADHVQVKIEDGDLCYSYQARVVQNVTVGPSPEWMQKRLRSAGVRPINNIVDITNYVMLELGQPMHAFDLQTVAGGKIIVRRAREGECIKTLDGQERKLDTSMLVIANEKEAMAVAGVMGGADSEIEPDSRTIVFESAVFKADSIRLTAQKLGMRTEASSRFEKGLDVHNAGRALDRACQLLEQLACGQVMQDLVSDFGLIPEERRISWDCGRINAFLGTEIPFHEMADLFSRLGCRMISETPGEAGPSGGLWLMPSYRPDLEGEADLAEEVARFYGYNKIKATLLSGKSFTRGGLNSRQSLNRSVQELCLGQGYYQCYSYTFESPKTDDWLKLPENSPLRRRVKLRNAAEDNSVMRSSMLPSMLRVAANNSRRQVQEGKFYEMATVFAELPQDGTLPREDKILSALCFDQQEDARSAASFYTMKGLLEDLLRITALSRVEYIEPTAEWAEKYPILHALNPYRTALVLAGTECLGCFGYVLPAVARNFSAAEATVYLEINMDMLERLAKFSRKQKALAKFPASSRDIALLVDAKHRVGDMEKAIQRLGRPYLTEVELFDVYTGKQLGEGKKSVAYRLSFRAADRTLLDADVQVLMDQIIKGMQKDYAAEIRK